MQGHVSCATSWLGRSLSPCRSNSPSPPELGQSEGRLSDASDPSWHISDQHRVEPMRSWGSQRRGHGQAPEGPGFPLEDAQEPAAEWKGQ